MKIIKKKIKKAKAPSLFFPAALATVSATFSIGLKINHITPRRSGTAIIGKMNSIR
jgi:hypothetical protein